MTTIPTSSTLVADTGSPTPPVETTTPAAPQRPRRLQATLTLLTIALSALLAGGLFAAVFVSIFGQPEPESLPVAVAVVGVDANMVQQAAGDRYAITASDLDTALDQLNHRTVYAVIEIDATHGQINLTYSSAEGSSILAFTQPVAESIAEATHLPLNLTNITPDVPANAAPGRSLFFAAFGAALAGFIFSQALNSVSSTLGLSLRVRLLMMGLVSVGAGLIVALILGPWFNVIPLGVAQTWPILTLLSLSIVAGSTALIDLVGQIGQVLAAVLFTVLGNATSTGILPMEFLSDPLQVISSILPTGNVVRGLMGQAFFSGASVGEAYLVPALWAVGSLVVIVLAATFQKSRRHAAPVAT